MLNTPSTVSVCSGVKRRGSRRHSLRQRRVAFQASKRVVGSLVASLVRLSSRSSVGPRCTSVWSARCSYIRTIVKQILQFDVNTALNRLASLNVDGLRAHRQTCLITKDDFVGAWFARNQSLSCLGD